MKEGPCRTAGGREGRRTEGVSGLREDGGEDEGKKMKEMGGKDGERRRERRRMS